MLVRWARPEMLSGNEEESGRHASSFFAGWPSASRVVIRLRIPRARMSVTRSSLRQTDFNDAACAEYVSQLGGAPPARCIWTSRSSMGTWAIPKARQRRFLVRAAASSESDS
jgi:hypothetical protein